MPAIFNIKCLIFGLILAIISWLTPFFPYTVRLIFKINLIILHLWTHSFLLWRNRILDFKLNGSNFCTFSYSKNYILSIILAELFLLRNMAYILIESFYVNIFNKLDAYKWIFQYFIDKNSRVYLLTLIITKLYELLHLLFFSFYAILNEILFEKRYFEITEFSINFLITLLPKNF